MAALLGLLGKGAAKAASIINKSPGLKKSISDLKESGVLDKLKHSATKAGLEALNEHTAQTVRSVVDSAFSGANSLASKGVQAVQNIKTPTLPINVTERNRRQSMSPMDVALVAAALQSQTQIPQSPPIRTMAQCLNLEPPLENSPESLKMAYDCRSKGFDDFVNGECTKTVKGDECRQYKCDGFYPTIGSCFKIPVMLQQTQTVVTPDVAPQPAVVTPEVTPQPVVTPDVTPQPVVTQQPVETPEVTPQPVETVKVTPESLEASAETQLQSESDNCPPLENSDPLGDECRLKGYDVYNLDTKECAKREKGNECRKMPGCSGWHPTFERCFRLD